MGGWWLEIGGGAWAEREQAPPMHVPNTTYSCSTPYARDLADAPGHGVDVQLGDVGQAGQGHVPKIHPGRGLGEEAEADEEEQEGKADAEEDAGWSWPPHDLLLVCGFD